MAEFDVVLIAAPDPLARKYVHQLLLIEELQGRGCRVEFVERPMSSDPNDDQLLLLQIRGAVAEYERTLIAERMRRGRLAKLGAGQQLLPWMTMPLGYRTDPERPRDPAGLRVDEYEAAIVRQMFVWYLEQGATLGTIARRLTEGGILTPTGKSNWSRGTIRGILKNTAYMGVAHGNTTRQVPAKSRKSPLLPVGPGVTNGRRAQEEWIPITVPAIVSQEVSSRWWPRSSRTIANVPRATTRLTTICSRPWSVAVLAGKAPTTPAPPGTGAATTFAGGVVVARSFPSNGAGRDSSPQHNWTSWSGSRPLCEVLTHPEHVRAALERAHGGEWLPLELKARLESVEQAIAQTERQKRRLLDAYLGGVLELAEFERKRNELDGRRDALLAQKRQLEASARERA